MTEINVLASTSVSSLTSTVNTYIRTHLREANIEDIKYAVAQKGANLEYSAMIIYSKK
jgi:hypothetical protein